MVWEALFLLVVLKIPVIYLCAVVWWAIKAEPTPDEPLAPALVADTPPTPTPWTPPARDAGPRGARRRGERRSLPPRRGARAEARG